VLLHMFSVNDSKKAYTHKTGHNSEKNDKKKITRIV